MAEALIESESLTDREGWEPTIFASGKKMQLTHGAVPRQVETVVNHRVINRRQIVAGVSGGVMVAPGDVLRETRMSDVEALSRERSKAAQSQEDSSDAWWWDATK